MYHPIKTLSQQYSSCITSLTPGRFRFNFRKVIFKLTLVNGGWGTSYEIVLRWMPQDLTDDMSTLVQVMAWCRQATSHYLRQSWPESMSPYGIIRPQWVNIYWQCILIINPLCLLPFSQFISYSYVHCGFATPCTCMWYSQTNLGHHWFRWCCVA